MTRQAILEEAIRCVTKDRNATHGEPEDNFRNIAAFWNAWMWMKFQNAGSLAVKLGKDPVPVSIEVLQNLFTPTDVAVMMDLMKTSRLVQSPECADHWIDKCGYAACGGGIATKENEPDYKQCDRCGQHYTLSTLEEAFCDCGGSIKRA